MSTTKREDELERDIHSLISAVGNFLRHPEHKKPRKELAAELNRIAGEGADRWFALIERSVAQRQHAKPEAELFAESV